MGTPERLRPTEMNSYVCLPCCPGNMECLLIPICRQSQLIRLAARPGRASEVLVVEAFKRLVHCDVWFLREVEKGLAAADRGEFVDQSDLSKPIDERYPG